MQSSISTKHNSDIAVGIFLIVGVLLYLSLFLYNSLTRTRQFSPDSMNYVDVARNISRGKGITQSTLGYNQPSLFTSDSRIPSPFTAQPPLFPILIALVSSLGLTHADAALVIPLIAYSLILVIAYLLAIELYGSKHTALIILGGILFYEPLRFAARTAWTESVAVAFLFLSMWLLLRISRPCQEINRLMLMSFGCGISTGLAFAIRYALMPLFLIGLFSLIFERSHIMRPLRAIFCYSAGFSIPAVYVFGHNILSGASLLPTLLPSDIGFTENVRDAFFSVAGTWFSTSDMFIEQAAFAGIVLGACVISLIKRRKLFYTLEISFLRNGHYLLTVWVIGYLCLLIYQRTTYHFDTIDSRLVLPSGVILIVLCTGFLSNAVEFEPAKKYLSLGMLMLLVLLSCAGEIRLMLNSAPYTDEQEIVRSERLSWIARYATDKDIIIGDDTMDIPFHFEGRAAISFTSYPYNRYITYPDLTGYISHNAHHYENIYLILRETDVPIDQQPDRFGRMIADIRAGRLENYPCIIPVDRLKDALTFRVYCSQ